MKRGPENPYESPPTVPSSGRTTYSYKLLTLAADLARTFLVILIVVVGPFIWILRDGLGPDATDSSGAQALYRMFWMFHWGPAIVVTTSVLVVALYLQTRLANSSSKP